MTGSPWSFSLSDLYTEPPAFCHLQFRCSYSCTDWYCGFCSWVSALINCDSLYSPVPLILGGSIFFMCSPSLWVLEESSFSLLSFLLVVRMKCRLLSSLYAVQDKISIFKTLFSFFHSLPKTLDRILSNYIINPNSLDWHSRHLKIWNKPVFQMLFLISTYIR